MAHNQTIRSVEKSKILEALLSKIEEQLKWGSSQEWSSVDFENLSDLIFQKSQQRISVTTLKRTWGRTSQSVKPSNTTLNILAQFTDAVSWRDFQNNHTPEINKPEKTVARDKQFSRKVYFIMGGLIFGVLIIALALGLRTSDSKATLPLKSEDIHLTIKKITQGIPNTVVFKFDIGSLKVNSLELQQSWDKRKRISLEPSDSLVTTTYHKPGYFSAKLVADGEIITHQDLYIPSDGLEVIVFVEGEEKPLLLPENHWSLGTDGFQLNNTFDESFSNRHKESTLIVNLLDQPLIAADSFEVRTSLRLTKFDEGDPCYPLSIIITGTKDVYMFDVGNPGCAGEFNAYLGGENLAGKDTDLSSMGFLADEWIDIVVLKNGDDVIYRSNGKEVILSTSAPSIGLLGGVRIQASQKIGLRKLEMEDKNQLIDLLKE